MVRRLVVAVAVVAGAIALSPATGGAEPDSCLGGGESLLELVAIEDAAACGTPGGWVRVSDCVQVWDNDTGWRWIAWFYNRYTGQHAVSTC